MIYPGGQDALDKLYQVAMEEPRKVDMSFIKPGQSVNILASHHGFTLLGGQPYAILIKATRDAIIEKTGLGDVRLRAGVVCAPGDGGVYQALSAGRVLRPRQDQGRGPY